MASPLHLSTPGHLASIVAVINEQVDAKRFSQLCEKTIVRLPCADAETLFSRDEKSKLQLAFGLRSAQQLSKVLALTLNVCQQFAYYAVEVRHLKRELVAVGFAEAIAEGCEEVWTRLRADTLARLKEFSDAPSQLTDLKWCLNVDVSGRDRAKIMEPTAGLQMTLESGKGTADQKKCINLEMNRSELLKVYDELERVQAHIDSCLR